MKIYHKFMFTITLVCWYSIAFCQQLDVSGQSVFRFGNGSISISPDGPGLQFVAQGGVQWNMYPVSGNLGMAIAHFTTPDLQRFRITEGGTLAVNKGVGGAKGGLHIRQLDALASSDGIFLEHPSNGNSWNTYINSENDLVLSYNGNSKAYFDNTDGSHHALSDRKLKEDVQPISSVLPAIGKLNPVTYKFKSSSDVNFRSWGFIAQEVEDIFPDFVRECEGFKTLGYDNFAVIAIKAIQEQQAEIEALRQEIQALK